MLGVMGLPLDDVEQVFVVLFVLYAVECCWWLRGDARRCFPAPFARWGDPPPAGLLVDGWRLSFSNPWPWGEGYTVEPWRFPFDAKHLLVPVLDPSTGAEHYEAVAWESLPAIAGKEREVWAGPTRLASCTSPGQASMLAQRLERLRTAGDSAFALGAGREAEAEDLLRSMWSLPAARGQHERWRHEVRLVRRLGGLLTVLALVCGPGVYALRAQVPGLLPLLFLACCGATWMITAVAVTRLQASHLAGSHSHRLHVLTAFLSPVSAMRIFDVCGRDVLVGFEPLVVAIAADVRAEQHSASQESGAADCRPGKAKSIDAVASEHAGQGLSTGADMPESLTEAWLGEALGVAAYRPRVPVECAAAVEAAQWFFSRRAELARSVASQVGVYPRPSG